MPTLFVAGHSDSGARYLPDGIQPWPERVRAWLEETRGEPWTLTAVPFAPMGAGATNYLIRKVEAAAPDILVLPFGAYVCTIGSVAESVRQRFGVRAGRAYGGAEGRVRAATQTGRVRRRARSLGQRVARRTLGTRTLVSVEEATAIFADVLHRLARIESLQVVAVLDARFSEPMQRLNPRIHTVFERMEAELLPIVESHRFGYMNLEGALRATPDRAQFYHEDGIHTTAAFHDVYFEALKSALP
jgi:hypothetical protein